MATALYIQKFSNIVNSSSVNLALSMSKDVGILQVLLEAEHPLTSVEIADKKQLKERYVRELLGSLGTAEIVHVQKNEEGGLVYHIEEEEKQAFRMPIMACVSFPVTLSTVYDTIKTCITKSGPYGTWYTDAIQDCLAEYSSCNIGTIVEKTLSSVDGLREKLETGIEVIEFGCGRGHLLAKFAQMFPKSTFMASEVRPSLLDHLKASMGHIPNIVYEINDLCSLPEPPTKKYEWIYCVNVIHDLPYPLEALRGIRKLVNEPNGIFTMIDIDSSGSPIDDSGKLSVARCYAISTFMCIPDSFQRDDSHAPGACWGNNTAISLCKAADFNVRFVECGSDSDLAIFICKPSFRYLSDE